MKIKYELLMLSLPSILTTILVILKGFGYIDWHWFYIFSPIIIELSTFLSIIFYIFILIVRTK